MIDYPQAPLPPLVVGSDPVRTERATRPSFVLTLVAAALVPVFAATVAALIASSSGFAMGFVSALPLLLVSWFTLFTVAQVASVRGARSRPGTVLTLDTAGLHSSIEQGDVFLPWPAIERLSVRRRGKYRILTFHLAPGLTAQSPGIHSTLPAKSFATLSKLGFQLGEVAIDCPLDTVIAASTALTGGRLR